VAALQGMLPLSKTTRGQHCDAAVTHQTAMALGYARACPMSQPCPQAAMTRRSRSLHAQIGTSASMEPGSRTAARVHTPV